MGSLARRCTVACSAALALAAPRSAGADSVLVFNEVMYHPAGDEARLEWVELHSQMAVDLDLSGWELAGGIQFRIPEGTVVKGGGFLVVAVDPQALAAAGGPGGALGPFTGRLDNSGERIEVRNHSGRLMDSLRYGDSDPWPAAPDGSGVSLAKLDPDAASAPAENWTWSARAGGTPGAHNFPLAGPLARYPPGLVSYWSFDEPSGRALDALGGNHGTVGTAATRVPGLIGGGALSFNNTSSAYVSVGQGLGNNFAATTGVTIEALIRPSWGAAAGDHDEVFRKEDGDRRVLLAFQNDGNQNGFSEPAVGPGPVLSFGLNIAGVYRELDLLLDGLGGRPALAALKDGETHHVAASYDGGSGLKAIYIDGALAHSFRYPAGSSIASGGNISAYIGNLSGRTEPFTGTIDEVAYHTRALSAGEIAQHAARARAGSSYFPDPEVEPASPKLAFNETFIALVGDSWVELLNPGPAPAPVDGLVLAVLGPQAGQERVLAAPPVPAGGYLVLSEAHLGLDLAPETRLFLYAAGKEAVVDALRLLEGSRARLPEGSGRWLLPERPSPGAANRFTLHDEIVINEILYHRRAHADGGSFQESSEAWIELLNRSGSAVDLGGWTIAGGVDFAFEPETVLGPGDYLVVAADRDALQALHPSIRIAGNLSRRLSHKSDRIVLLDARGNPADEVRYHDGGRWPEYADGGGSSLELVDPRADNSRPEAWAASDESTRSEWRSYSYRGLAQAGVGPTRWNEFVLGLLDAGEAVIDDVSVVESPAGTARELIQNRGFDAGTARWRLLGNHGQSRAAADPLDPAERVLHLVATGPTEHMHNHVETTLAGGAAVVNGREYQVSFRAKWLAGSNQLHTRLYFNRLPRTTHLQVPAATGTPGGPNSRLRGNAGPTYDGFRHAPVAPAAGQEVVVSVAAEDPDGVAALTLWYAVGGGAFRSVPMEAGSGGVHAAVIPGQAPASLVHFYVEGRDALGAASTFPAAGPKARALYRVEDGQAALGRVHNLRLLMTPADTTLLHQETNVMSNARLGATVVYDEKLAFYDVGVRLKGSERGRPVDGRVGFNIKFHPDRRFRGVHETVHIDRSGGWKFGGPFGQDEVLIKHMVNRAGGIPGMYDDLIRVIAPRGSHTGSALLLMARFDDVYLDSQYERGSDGTAYELELIYYPTTTVDGSSEGLKRPQPDEVLGTDVRDLGNDKEVYRWSFLIENHRDRDDYGPMIGLGKAFSLPAATLEAGTRAVMDVDEWMRTFAVYSLAGVNDAYTQGNNHNVVFYARPADGKMLAFPWDMDFAYVLPTNRPLWGDQNLGRVIALPANARLFYGHLRDLIARSFNAAYLAPWAAHYGSLAGQDYSSIPGYIRDRANYVLANLPAAVPFAITTNGGRDLTVSQVRTTIEGSAWIDVRQVYDVARGEPLELSWPATTRWRAAVELDLGVNPIELMAFDAQGDLVGEDSIAVTSTGGFPAPAAEAVDPPQAKAGDTIAITGTGFKAGIRVLFAGVRSPLVAYDEAASPGRLKAQVPALPPGAAPIRVENSDGRTSEPAEFTVLPPRRFVRGDLNLDGEVDLADVLRVLLHLFRGSPTPCLDAGDATDDERLNLADAVYLLEHLFREGPAPLPPYPAPGEEPEAEGPLGCAAGLGL